MKTSHATVVALALAVLCGSGCAGSSGNLYFLSSQRVGVEVIFSDPTSNAAPKAILGYESVKGTVNPVKDDSGTLRERAYSVLGITGTSASGGGGAGLAVSEWFATGHAAVLLAMNKLTPLALAGTTTLTPEVLALATSQGLARTFSAIAGAQVWLASLAAPSARQVQILADLNALDTVASELEFSTFAADGARAPFVAPAVPGWSRVEQARAALRNSIVLATERSQRTDITPAEQQAAADAAAALQGKLDEFDRRILASPAAQAVWAELVQIVEQGGE